MLDAVWSAEINSKLRLNVDRVSPDIGACGAGVRGLATDRSTKPYISLNIRILVFPHVGQAVWTLGSNYSLVGHRLPPRTGLLARAAVQYRLPSRPTILLVDLIKSTAIFILPGPRKTHPYGTVYTFVLLRPQFT